MRYSLIGKTKGTHTIRTNQGIHSLLPMAGQVFSTFRRAGPHPWISDLGRQKPSLQTSPFLLHSPLYILSCCQMVWNTPLVRVPVLSMSPRLLPVRQQEQQNRLCVSPAQQQQSHLCVSTPVFSTAPFQPLGEIPTLPQPNPAHLDNSSPRQVWNQSCS